MKLRRDIAAVPLRTGAAAWSTVIDLISKPSSIDTDQLRAAATVLATLLSEELYAQHPLTLKGDGHRLVIYFSYGADALTLGDAVTALDWNPTAKDWTLYLPCDEEDLTWVKESLSKRAPRFRIHGLGETPAELNDEEQTAKAADFTIDWSAA